MGLFIPSGPKCPRCGQRTLEIDVNLAFAAQEMALSRNPHDFSVIANAYKIGGDTYYTCSSCGCGAKVTPSAYGPVAVAVSDSLAAAAKRRKQPKVVAKTPKEKLDEAREMASKVGEYAGQVAMAELELSVLKAELGTLGSLDLPKKMSIKSKITNVEKDLSSKRFALKKAKEAEESIPTLEAEYNKSRKM